jgi:kynurenine formamidase
LRCEVGDLHDDKKKGKDLETLRKGKNQGRTNSTIIKERRTLMKKKTSYSLILILSSLLFIFAFISARSFVFAQKDDLSLWELFETKIKPRAFVDLTHAFAPGIPRWPGFPSEERKIIYTYEKDGFQAELFTHVGQYGTHCDPPGHFQKGLRMLDEIPVKEMIMPLVVIDCSQKVLKNPDYQLVLEDIETWETRHGRIPQGAFVAMRTDWYKRFSDMNAFYNKDAKGQTHYPGWTIKALKFLFDERGITAIGHEPIDSDAAITQVGEFFSCESYVLKSNHFQIELIANLDKVPDAGALLVCTWPKPKAGSGFPARLFAIIPGSGLP